MKAGGSTYQLYQHGTSSKAGGTETSKTLEVSSSSQWVMGWESSRMRVYEVGTGLRMLAPGPVTVKKTSLLGVGKNVLTPKGILE